MAALALAASCVSPPPVDRTVVSVPVSEAADARLLRDLALAVPRDRSARILPPPARIDVPPPFALGQAGDDAAARAADCLSAAVYYEARSEPVDGQRAVAQVVLNRVRDRAFPASVCRVVYQRSSRGCQFSFACDGSTDRPIEPRAWALAAAVARAALAGAVYAPVGSATHYHTTAILPWWAPSLARIGVIGHHVFYRWASRLGEALSFRQAYSGLEAPPTIAAVPAARPNVRLAAVDPLPTGHAAVADDAVAFHRGAAPGLVAAVGYGVRVHRGMQIDDADAPTATAEIGD